MQLTDRVALVTGGGSGIGRAVCLRFGREGAAVVAVDLRPERAQETIEMVKAGGGDGMALKADVADDASIHRAVQMVLEEYNVVDILVNNAAISVGSDILTIDEATWDLNLAVVLKSVFLVTRAVLPGMLAQKRGAIVNISSVNGQTGIGEEPYSAAKAGVINLTKNLAVRYGHQGVRANVVCPGTIETPIWGERLQEDPDIFDKLAEWYPLGRVGKPEDVANAVLFLASDEASWITGSVLNVDGGLMAGAYRLSQDLGGG